MMLRYVFAFALVVMAGLGAAGLGTIFLGTTASALTPEEKMETCKFGADHQKLAGAKRKKFLAQCMSDAEAKPAKGK
jgi:hypothetical protein